MPKPTTTSYAVLGLLSVRNWTTYELAKQVQRSLNWFWPRAERKLYDEPKTLVSAGWADAVKEFTGQRPRTVYEITGTGRQALQEWLDEPPAPRTTEFEAMLKVFFADAGSLDQLQRTIGRVAGDAQHRISELKALIGRTVDGDMPFPQRAHISALTLRLQLDQEETVLRWSQWAAEQSSQWASTTDPGDWDPIAVMRSLIQS